MAAVFDLDLETEEGSEGEGEPEFSPAVSVSLWARLDPGVPLVNQSPGAPYFEWFVTPKNPDPAPTPSPAPDPIFPFLPLISPQPFPTPAAVFLSFVLSPGPSSSA